MEGLKTEIRSIAKDLVIDFSLIEKKIESISSFETVEYYDTLARSCADNTIHHPNWSILAGRVKLKSVKYFCGLTFLETTEKAKAQLHDKYYNFVIKFQHDLNEMIVEERDDKISWFGICTAINSYLLKIKTGEKENEKGEKEEIFTVIETLQQMYLRVAVWLGMHYYDVYTSKTGNILDRIKDIYNELSLNNYIHATPTLFNSGLRRPQLSSCFLKTVGDNMESIAERWRDSAMISKTSGGIGIDISDIRHSEINGGGKSSGIVPMLKVFNEILCYVDQGGKRKGSATIYICDYHIDIFDFIELRKPNGAEKKRARDLFYAVWVSDLFMKRVEEDGIWSLFCPNIAKGLNDVWGDDFEKLYLEYEEKNLYFKRVPARELWKTLYVSWVEIGMPFMLFKDACNRKSNQKNLGTIRCSNLCTEIVQFTSEEFIASCNLSNIPLNNCVRQKQKIFDFQKLDRVIRACVRNINIVIDINYYHDNVPAIKKCNMLTRPMGIGVQGFADTFAILDMCWNSEEAYDLNKKIFETMYFAAITESIKIAKERDIEKKSKIELLKKEYKSLIEEHSIDEEKLRNILNKLKVAREMETYYPTFPNSPTSKGIMQFDMWAMEAYAKKNNIPYNDVEKNFNPSLYDYDFLKTKISYAPVFDWDTVRSDLKKYGLRNSLLLAPMPTASTAHLIDNNESIELFTNLVYARTVLSGQYMLVNKHMVKDFENVIFGNIWSIKLFSDIVVNDGSIQALNLEDYIETPTQEQIDRFKYLKKKYLTAYEIEQKVCCRMGIDRGRFICQSQSFNCYMQNPSYQKMTSYMFYQWKNGAKTGMYYLRNKAAVKPLTISLSTKKQTKKEVMKKYICQDDVCVMCQ